MFEKTHHNLTLYGQYFVEGLLMDLLDWVYHLHFLGKEMLNFAEGEVHRQVFPALIASGDFVSNTDRQVSHLALPHRGLWRYFIETNGYMTLRELVIMVVEQQVSDIEKNNFGGVNVFGLGEFRFTLFNALWQTF